MSIVLLNSVTILLYCCAAGLQLLARHRTKLLVLGCALIAIFCQGWLLHHNIDTQTGQNLSPANLLSLASWLIVLFFVILALVKPIEQLGMIVFPLAAISMAVAWMMPGTHIVATVNDMRQLVHILLAIVTFSVLALAGLLAMLLSLQDRRLRSNSLSGWMSRMPPLETLEQLLFQMIALGFILLTGLLLSSFYFYHDELWRLFWSKALVTVGAWVIFAVLIIGRKLLGWRGRKAIFCTLLGLGLVFCLYFGSVAIKGIA